MAEAPQTDDEARAGSDRRASTSAKRASVRRRDRARRRLGESRRRDATDEGSIQTLETTALAHEAISMWLGAAVLGPLLDHQHSRFDVLHYFQPVTLDLASGLVRSVAEKTAGAAPAALAFFFQREAGVFWRRRGGSPLFGGAGVVIGLGHTLGDGLRLRAGALKETFEGVDKQTFLASVSRQTRHRLGTGAENGGARRRVLRRAVLLQRRARDDGGEPVRDPERNTQSRRGRRVGGLGTRRVVGLRPNRAGFRDGEPHRARRSRGGDFPDQRAHLYAYAAPDVLGVPTWIPWVYFCGAPAVGLLARAVRAERRAALRLPADGGRRASPAEKGVAPAAARVPSRGPTLGGWGPIHTRRAPSARRRAGPTRAAEGEGDRGSGGRRRRERERGELREL